MTFFTGGSLALFLFTLFGCGKTDQAVLYKDIFTKVIRYESNGFETPVAEYDTCSAATCFLEGTLDITQIVFRTPLLPGNSAWAFQPGPRHYAPVEKISGLKVVTLRRFNSQYAGGTDMTADCRFRFGTAIAESVDSSAASAVAEMNEGYSDRPATLASGLRIYFAAKPDIIAQQQFAIELKTETGAVIRDTSIIFHLKP